MQGSRNTSFAAIRLGPTIVIGLAVVALTFGGFGTWAAVVPLASAVVSEAVVKVASNRKALQHRDGGVVKEILVEDGGSVKKGTVLVRLDNVRASTTLANLRNQYDAARARVARLKAEKDGTDFISYPDDLQQLAPTDESIRQLLRSEVDVFFARREALLAETGILTQKIDQLKKQEIGEEAQLSAKKRQADLIKDELRDLEPLLDQKLVQKSRVTNLQREAARLDGEVGAHVAAAAELALQITEIDAKMVQSKTNFRKEVVEELRKTEDQIADLQTRIMDAEHTLQNTDITAPSDGVVMGISVHAIGEVVPPGGTILEIVPEDDRLMVEASIPPKDVEDLHVGMDATVRLTAYRQRTTPVIKGRVAYVSADRFTDERTQRSYYVVRVEVDTDFLKGLDDIELQPGMPAEVMIATGERTPLAYFIQPIMDGLSRAWREK